MSHSGRNAWLGEKGKSWLREKASGRSPCVYSLRSGLCMGYIVTALTFLEPRVVSQRDLCFLSCFNRSNRKKIRTSHVIWIWSGHWHLTERAFQVSHIDSPRQIWGCPATNKKPSKSFLTHKHYNRRTVRNSLPRDSGSWILFLFLVLMSGLMPHSTPMSWWMHLGIASIFLQVRSTPLGSIQWENLSKYVHQS